ncbi:MerR family transcriptional regulator, partial [Clostridioides difficile]
MNKKPLTVHEVVNLTGITARTLHYYDEIGLLKPSIVTEAKYRLYTDTDLCRLQEVLFFRGGRFALKRLKLLNSPHYNG